MSKQLSSEICSKWRVENPPAVPLILKDREGGGGCLLNSMISGRSQRGPDEDEALQSTRSICSFGAQCHRICVVYNSDEC